MDTYTIFRTIKDVENLEVICRGVTQGNLYWFMAGLRTTRTGGVPYPDYAFYYVKEIPADTLPICVGA